MRTGTNLHVHTNHSFSVFASPQAAVAAAVAAGVEAFGIVDFYTTAGYAEFSAACNAASLPAVFGIEVVTLDAEAQRDGVLMNDPGNPGRTYLCGKAVTRPQHAGAQALLQRLRAVQERRNRALTVKVDERFRSVLGASGPTWDAVVGQTPVGNTTERHVVKATLRCLIALGGDVKANYEKLAGAPMPADDVAQQNDLRGRLLKSGKPCYVAEEADGFPPIADGVRLMLDLGAIPTYPVLGNPLTGGETDIPKLCDRLERLGVRALELIPARNTDDRVAAVVAEAARRGWPVFDGTEHNTPALDPITTKWGMDERFRPAFRAGAAVALGHQAERAAGRLGYVDDAGVQVPGGLARCRQVGEALLVTR